jgi:ketol-acid reductoisomerase
MSLLKTIAKAGATVALAGIAAGSAWYATTQAPEMSRELKEQYEPVSRSINSGRFGENYTHETASALNSNPEFKEWDEKSGNFKKNLIWIGGLGLLSLFGLKKLYEREE